MASLIESILSLETQANQVVEQARQEAKRLETEAEARIAENRKTVAAAVERRVEEFRAQTAARVAEELAAAERDHESAKAKMQTLPKEKVQEQVGVILGRLQAKASGEA